ncbi:MAG: hypothetical protein ABGW77_04725 [Campylobacterales bacterium]
MRFLKSLLIGVGMVWGVSLTPIGKVEGVHFYNFYRSFESCPTSAGWITAVGYYTHTATPEEIAEARGHLEALIGEGVKRRGFQQKLEKGLEEGFKKFSPPQWLEGFFPKEWAKEAGKWLFTTLLKYGAKIGEFETPVGRLGKVGVTVIKNGKIEKVELGVETPVSDLAISPTGEIGVLLDCSSGQQLAGRVVLLNRDLKKEGDWLFKNLTFQLEFTPGEREHLLALLFTNPTSRWWKEKGIRFFNYKKGQFLKKFLLFSAAGTPGTGGLDRGFDFHPPYFQFTPTQLITADGRVYSYPSLQLEAQLEKMGFWWGVSEDGSYLLSDRTLYETKKWRKLPSLRRYPYTFQFAGEHLWVTFPPEGALQFSLPSVKKESQIREMMAPTPVGEWVVGVSRRPPFQLLLFKKGEGIVARYPLQFKKVVALLPAGPDKVVAVGRNQLLLLKIEQ